MFGSRHPKPSTRECQRTSACVPQLMRLCYRLGTGHKAPILDALITAHLTACPVLRPSILCRCWVFLLQDQVGLLILDRGLIARPLHLSSQSLNLGALTASSLPTLTSQSGRSTKGG
ncbi:hypothetical protein LIA77_08828 [Sarocladium implicatum]|nr:hypothetical protein LIA77_08828 [Sarocladium implicatum]